MRFLLYNIRYGTGNSKPQMPWSGYLRRTHHSLGNICQFIHFLDSDIVGLVEVDGGFFRMGKLS